jgi:hypothetical protein
MVQIMDTHVCKCKNEPVQTFQESGQGDGGEQWRG